LRANRSSAGWKRPSGKACCKVVPPAIWNDEYGDLREASSFEKKRPDEIFQAAIVLRCPLANYRRSILTRRDVSTSSPARTKPG